LYTGVDSIDIACGIDVPDNLKSSKVVVRLMEPLLNLGYSL
jgi:hypothetical protein